MEREAVREGWDGLPWVFCGRTGKRLHQGNFINRVWHPAVERAGLSHRTPHDMRHTYATLRLSLGHPLAEVSKEMGHSTTDITYRTYYKWIPSESISDIDRLDHRPNE